MNPNSINVILRRQKENPSEKIKNNQVKLLKGFKSPEKIINSSLNSKNSIKIIENIDPFKHLTFSFQKRFLPLLLKKIISQSFLNSVFEKINHKIKIKKFALTLLRRKQNNNLSDAFFILKSTVYNQKEKIYIQKVSSNCSPKLLYILFNKLLKTKLKQSFLSIKKISRRKKDIIIFCQKLYSNFFQYLKRQMHRCFLYKLKYHLRLVKWKTYYLQKLEFLNKKRVLRLLNLSINKIINYSIYNGYQSMIEQRKQKNKQIICLSSSRKTLINQQKQKVKKLKHSYDSVNLQKNRSFNDLKKSRTMIKNQMNIDIRSLKKQEEELQNELEQTSSILLQSNYILSIRKGCQQKTAQKDFIQKVMQLYSSIQNYENEQISITHLDKIIEREECKIFESTAEFYFHNNFQLMSLIYLYQRVKIPSLEQRDLQYVQKFNEHNTLINTISLLSQREISKQIHGYIIKFNRQFNQDSSFSPPKVVYTNIPTQQQVTKKQNIFIQENNNDSFLPASSKNSKKSSSQQNTNRIVGKITSKANYFNN